MVELKARWNTLQTNSEGKRLKGVNSVDNNVNVKGAAEASSGMANKQMDQIAPPPEPPKQDYIHVRARRGQATDSHSLAERVRFSLKLQLKLRYSLPPWYPWFVAYELLK